MNFSSLFAKTNEPPLALITGASAGLGKIFAQTLAQKKFHLFLIARNESKLHQLAEELQNKYLTPVNILAADLGNHESFLLAEKKIAHLRPISLLINNAGFGMGTSFLHSDAQLHEDMIRLHLVATIRLTHAALLKMVPQNSGGIINVSSIAGFLPWGGGVTYGATKCGLTFFSEALRSELSGTKIRVQTLCPGLTHTEFHQRAKMNLSTPSWVWMNPQEVVNRSLSQLARKSGLCIPGWHNRLFVALTKAVPCNWLGPFFRKAEKQCQTGL